MPLKSEPHIVDGDEDSPLNLPPPEKRQKPKHGGISLDLTEKEMSATPQYPATSKDWAEKFKAENEQAELGFNKG